MNVEVATLHTTDGPLELTVTLSRRNLQTLLAKLDEPDSARTLIRDVESGHRLVIVAQDDAEHYADRPAGAVHPREETRVSRPPTGVTAVHYLGGFPREREEAGGSAPGEGGKDA